MGLNQAGMIVRPGISKDNKKRVYLNGVAFLPRVSPLDCGNILVVDDFGNWVSSSVDIVGEPGKDGVTYKPSLSADGVLSWTNDGGLPNPIARNIKGYTPQKSIDYWTDDDKAEMVQEVISALPVYSGEVVE